MIQLIGLIIATYALVRLIQVPVESRDARAIWPSLSPWARFGWIAFFSLGGVVMLSLLTLLLLMSGYEVQR